HDRPGAVPGLGCQPDDDRAGAGRRWRRGGDGMSGTPSDSHSPGGAMSATGGLAPAWIAADWGTSRLRAWAMDAAGGILAGTASDAGMGSLTPQGFEAALLAAVDPWVAGAAAPVPVIACGMVGAR